MTGLSAGNPNPPHDQHFLYNALGWEHPGLRSPLLAARSLERMLETVRNDAFALAGLVEAYVGIGERDKAQHSCSRLLHVWSRADPGLKWFERAKSYAEHAELASTPEDDSPVAQRPYDPASLTDAGPNEWRSNSAPRLMVVDSEGNGVTLDNCRGKTVVLIFVAGAECDFFLARLEKLAAKREELDEKNAVVVAVAPVEPARLTHLKEEKALSIDLCADTQWVSGKRFQSYDELEEMRLNATILIDTHGRAHWSRHGGAAFENIELLLEMIGTVNRHTDSA